MPPRKRQKASDSSGGTTSTKSGKTAQPPKSRKKDERKDEILSQAYGMAFCETFYQMWNFCQEINPEEPLKALASAGLFLVGPYEVMSKSLGANPTNPVTYHLRWRFFYDPPELMTVMVTSNPDENPFHVGLLRDDPKDEKCVVVSNTGEDCKIEILGDNLFGAVAKTLSNKLLTAKGKVKAEMQKLSKNLHDYAKNHRIDVDANDMVLERRKRIVDPTFHGAGIVVPIDENEVGYRPVGDTPAKLKKMFKKIDEAENDDVRMIAFDSLQEIITYVQLANDEYDFGMGLELGMQMFCYGSKYLNKAASRTLSMAYHLLKRELYQKIIEQHLSDRRKGNYSRV